MFFNLGIFLAAWKVTVCKLQKKNSATLLYQDITEGLVFNFI